MKNTTKISVVSFACSGAEDAMNIDGMACK